MGESSTIQAFLEEGRVKGLAEEARRIILRLGRKRLGAVDETVEAKLNATVDLLKPYWGKPAVWNFKGGRGNPKLDRARRAPLPYSALILAATLFLLRGTSRCEDGRDPGGPMDSAAALEGARRYLSGLQPEDHHGDGVAQPPCRVANPWGQGYAREPRAGASELPSTDPQPRVRCGKA